MNPGSRLTWRNIHDHIRKEVSAYQTDSKRQPTYTCHLVSISSSCMAVWQNRRLLIVAMMTFGPDQSIWAVDWRSDHYLHRSNLIDWHSDHYRLVLTVSGGLVWCWKGRLVLTVEKKKMLQWKTEATVFFYFNSDWRSILIPIGVVSSVSSVLSFWSFTGLINIIKFCRARRANSWSNII